MQIGREIEREILELQGYSNIRLEEGPVAFGHPRSYGADKDLLSR
jgi:hypothetical protein